MLRYKTDEQMLEKYLPKFKAFTDERLTAENAKLIYNFLKPYHYDKDGLLLREAAKGILKSEVYAEFTDKECEQLPDSVWIAAIHSIAIRLANKQPYLLEEFWNRLSYIENIRLKGVPTRNDLNEKIEREYNAVFNAASADDLTSFHSEIEIKAKIRSILCDAFMTDETIQALIVTDNVLDDAYNFYIEINKASQVDLSVWEYLGKAEHDYLAERVYDHVTLAYKDYISEVKKMPPEKIIGEACKITIFADIQTSLDPSTSNFYTDKLKALLFLNNPLEILYDEWLDRDCSYMDDMTDMINDTAGKYISDNEQHNFDSEHEYEDEDELEL